MAGRCRRSCYPAGHGSKLLPRDRAPGGDRHLHRRGHQAHPLRRRPFALRAGSTADRRERLDAAEDDHRLYRRPQHHPHNRDARIRRCASAAGRMRDRLEHPLSRTGDPTGAARRDKLHDPQSMGRGIRVRAVAWLRFRHCDDQCWPSRNRTCRWRSFSSTSASNSVKLVSSLWFWRWSTFLPCAESAVAALGGGASRVCGRHGRCVLDNSTCSAVDRGVTMTPGGQPREADPRLITSAPSAPRSPTRSSAIVRWFAASAMSASTGTLSATPSPLIRKFLPRRYRRSCASPRWRCDTRN